MQTPKPYKNAYKAATLHPKTIYYQSDGTGRDQYINVTSGGQFSTINTNFEYRENFKRSLRQYSATSPGVVRGIRPTLSAKVTPLRKDVRTIYHQESSPMKDDKNSLMTIQDPTLI
jgi:hypothetical protein